MWRIQILKYFDYSAWLDVDAVVFNQTEDIFGTMQKSGAYMGIFHFLIFCNFLIFVVFFLFVFFI
jgi:hypothetical protein